MLFDVYQISLKFDYSHKKILIPFCYYLYMLNKNNKNECYTIVVIDSGLGGVSIAAKIYEYLKNKEAKIIFFNALHSRKKSYGKLKTKKDQVILFDKVLKSVSTFGPDLIVIACNTLSMIYPFTTFNKKREINVLTISDFAISEIIKNVTKDTSLIIFGTPITIKEKLYETSVRKKFPKLEIIPIPCKDLARAIDTANKTNSEKLIRKYVNESIKNTKNKKVLVSLNCTHFDYFKDYFKEMFDKSNMNSKIISPNEIQAKKVSKIKLPLGQASFEMISRVKINDVSLNDLTNRLDVSKEFITKLKDYTYNRSLF